MSEHRYFEKALSDFTFDAANKGAICHLAGKGYTVRQIMKELDFPASYEKVRQAVWDYLIKERIILLEEPGSIKPKEKEIYIKEHGKFGKTSFRRVVVSEEEFQSVHWKESRYGKASVGDPEEFLLEKCRKNGRKTAYAACDFGILQKKDPNRYDMLLSALQDRQREYLEGLPWAFHRVYHCLDVRMSEVICHLLGLEDYGICCYFMELGEKIILE